MLTVCIELEGTVVAVFGGVEQPGLERAGQPQIYRQVDQPEAVLTAQRRSVVAAAVVYHNVIVLGIMGHQLVHHVNDVALLVVGRDHDQ